MRLNIMKYSIAIFVMTLFGEKAISQVTYQNKEIVSTWVSEEDNNWKIIFTKDLKCFQYYSDSLIETDSYVISNISPQCGITVPVNDYTRYIGLTDITTGSKTCYEINGITEKTLSLTSVDKGRLMLFHRDTNTLTMASSYSLLTSDIKNNGTNITLNLLFYSNSVMLERTIKYIYQDLRLNIVTVSDDTDFSLGSISAKSFYYRFYDGYFRDKPGVYFGLTVKFKDKVFLDDYEKLPDNGRYWSNQLYAFFKDRIVEEEIQI